MRASVLQLMLMVEKNKTMSKIQVDKYYTYHVVSASSSRPATAFLLEKKQKTWTQGLVFTVVLFGSYLPVVELLTV